MAAIASIRPRPLCHAVQLALALGLAAGSAQGGVPPTPTLPLSSPHNLRLDGMAEDDRSGRSVAAAGDINGDGLDDLIVGAPYADPDAMRDDAGSSYVVFGRSTGFASDMMALASLDGTTGFRLDGAVADDRSGRSVAAAGDINGDGLGDLIIGAPRADLNGVNSGSSYVVFGRSTGFASTMALTSLNGSTGFRLDGAAAIDFSGWSVAAAGDINGDGLDDLIIGAPYADPNAMLDNAGSSYVLFGRSTGFASTMALTSLNGSTGFRLDGAVAGDRSGWSVAAAGDINGDGRDDLIIGAWGADPNMLSNAGSSYVVFGRSTGFASSMALSSLNGSTGFRLDGAVVGDRTGESVAAAGDINGDGLGDLIIGAPRADPNGVYSGSSYVVFGRSTAFASAIDLSTLAASTGFRLDGAAASDQSGESVAAAGDINGDGVDDLIIGAPFADSNGVNSGSSYVLFGRDTTLPESAAFPSVMNLSTLTGLQLDGAVASDFSGLSVAAAGDINGDGLDDLIIGAPYADPDAMRINAGSTYVVFLSIFRDGFEN